MANDAAPGQLTRTQLLAETSRVEKQMLEATERTLRKLNSAEMVGAATLESLARQNEQIDDVAANLDRMRTDLAQADVMLRKIASPFAFMFSKAKAKEFETVFGSPAQWSGPLGKKRLLGFKQRYFVLHLGTLMYFDSSSGTSLPTDLSSPRDQLRLNLATEIEPAASKLEITIRDAARRVKWVLRCADNNDFVGWLTMLEQQKAGELRGPQSARSPIKSSGWLEARRPEQADSQGGPAAPLSVSEQVDANLDLMLKGLEALGTQALEQKQAMDFQLGKLDVVCDSMSNTSGHIADVQQKHRRRLK